MTPPALRIGWHADSFDPKLASIRYRMMLPMAGLRRLGIETGRIEPGADPSAYRAIVFSKSNGAPALALARAAKAAGTPIVYDLCDNLVAASNANRFSRARYARWTTLLELADLVTLSTPVLADQLAAAFPALTAPLTVVPDALDTDGPGEGAAALLARERWVLGRLDRFLAAHHGALRCVWFGNNLGPLSGYAHLGRAVEELERFSQRHPVTLTVISNDRLGFWRASREWRVPARYLPWSKTIQAQTLARHRVALIPVEQNAYTIGKTINRPATALLAGLGVVADAIPSYEELRPFIFLDDWQTGLAAYANDDAAAWRGVREGGEHLRARYGADAVALIWRAAIERAAEAVRPPRTPESEQLADGRQA